jgi:hypothetical protein
MYYRHIPQVQQLSRHSHSQRATLVPPLGAQGISKVVTHSPWLATSKGAHHCDFSDSTHQPTYPGTLQYPEISVRPGCVQCESAAEHCKITTRDCTQVAYKFYHQSLRNSHTYSTILTPDHAPCTNLPTCKTLLISTNC